MPAASKTQLQKEMIAMSTNALLACRASNGQLLAARLHFDGYPDRVLPILQTHYVEPESAESLIGLGEIRCFDDQTGDAQTYSDAASPLKIQRLELVLSIAMARGVSHVYLFEDGGWIHRAVTSGNVVS